MNYTVVWNGARNGPGGAQLSVPHEPRTAPPPAPGKPPRTPEADVRARVIDALSDRPQTMRELAEALNEYTERVNSALWLLQRTGEVVKVGKVKRQGGKRWGTEYEAVYGLPDQGEDDDEA